MTNTAKLGDLFAPVSTHNIEQSQVVKAAKRAAIIQRITELENEIAENEAAIIKLQSSRERGKKQQIADLSLRNQDLKQSIPTVKTELRALDETYFWLLLDPREREIEVAKSVAEELCDAYAQCRDAAQRQALYQNIAKTLEKVEFAHLSTEQLEQLISHEYVNLDTGLGLTFKSLMRRAYTDSTIEHRKLGQGFHHFCASVLNISQANAYLAQQEKEEKTAKSPKHKPKVRKPEHTAVDTKPSITVEKAAAIQKHLDFALAVFGAEKSSVKQQKTALAILQQIASPEYVGQTEEQRLAAIGELIFIQNNQGNHEIAISLVDTYVKHGGQNPEVLLEHVVAFIKLFPLGANGVVDTKGLSAGKFHRGIVRASQFLHAAHRGFGKDKISDWHHAEIMLMQARLLLLGSPSERNQAIEQLTLKRNIKVIDKSPEHKPSRFVWLAIAYKLTGQANAVKNVVKDAKKACGEKVADNVCLLASKFSVEKSLSPAELLAQKVAKDGVAATKRPTTSGCPHQEKENVEAVNASGLRRQ